MVCEVRMNGVIYITTTCVKGLIKIGKTMTNQFETRMNTLEQNGYWNVSGLKRYYAVEVEDYDEKEKLIHKVFSKSQVANSELFALDTDLAKEMLDSFNGKQIYPKVADKEEVQEEVVKTRKTPKSNLTFEMLHIPVGSMLYWYKDDNIIVKTVDNKNQVSYNGNVYSISKVVLVIKSTDKHYRGGLYFKYNGELLTELRKKLE